jgi:aryl-alcohol dehydrogenase-like predicted oxidoreductase
MEIARSSLANGTSYCAVTVIAPYKPERRFKLNPEKRRNIFLATKFGIVVNDAARGVDGSPKNVYESFSKSQKLLGVDQVELYYLHR